MRVLAGMACLPRVVAASLALTFTFAHAAPAAAAGEAAFIAGMRSSPVPFTVASAVFSNGVWSVVPGRFVGVARCG